MEHLAGKVAFVTGGGSGIGRSAALALAGEGVHVVVSDIDRDRAMAVADEASWKGTDCIGMGLDVNDQEAFETARDVIMRRLGHIDIVMNNVGVVASGLPEQIPVEEWERVISTNLLSMVRSNATFLPLLLEQGSGHIVNTASAAGLFAYAYERTPYSVSKAGVVALSEALALYLHPRHIGVTCLCPGPVATNIRQQVTFSGAPLRMRPPVKGMTPIDAAVVGDMVVDAIHNNRFLVLTHPELQDALIRRANDPEGFLADEIRVIEEA
jgi:NAD(P)-dependent dehydrogenase (short-subunit alcohol dehydrogenase family)